MAVVSLALASATTASAAVQDVHTYRFSNGLTLHVAPGHAAPVAAVQAWVGVGSADEGPAEQGIAHALEHMLFKGSSAYGKGELVTAIERGGGEINAWTSFDHTVFHAVLGRDHVGIALEALGDALLAPRVEPEELVREREVILEEIRHRSDDPARSVAQSLFATAYVAHPYRRPVIGTSESVRRLGERDLVQFFRTYYVADNLTLVVAGDVDPHRIRREVEHRFRAMPSGRPQRCVATEPVQAGARASCTYREIAEAHVAVGFHVPAIRHPDLAALDIAAILLGDSESARFPRLLRDRDELVTTASANLHVLRDPGLFALSATTRGADAVRAVGALVEHALAVVDDVGEDELDKARVAAEAAFVRQLETAQGRAGSLGWYASVAGDPQFGHVYLDRIRATRRHEVAHAMRHYLRSDNASVAAILPTRATRTFSARAESRVRRSLATRAATTPAAPTEKRVVLANGMVLLVRRDASVPVVAMRAVWRGGVRVEDAPHAGASAVLAQLIVRGCGTRDAAAVADQIDRLGGSLAGVSGRNSFGLAGEWLGRTWESGLDLFSDCVLAPTLAPAELERVQSQLGTDLAVQGESPAQIAFQTFSSALYGTHPYARDAATVAAAVGKLEPRDLSAFYRDRYPVSGMTLAIVGDIEVDAAIALVRARFERVKASTTKATPAAAPTLPVAPREVFRYLDRQQSHLVVGFPGATIDAPDRFALEVLVAILGGQGGRLFHELREQQALVYRVSMHSVEGVDPGFLAVYLACAPEKLPAAVAAVRAELARVRTDGVTAEELDRARNYLVGVHQIAMQRRAAVANAMAYHEAYGLGWESWTAYDSAIRAVRPADVNAAAARYLRADAMITATVMPPAPTAGAAKRSRAKPERAQPSRDHRTPAHRSKRKARGTV